VKPAHTFSVSNACACRAVFHRRPKARPQQISAQRLFRAAQVLAHYGEWKQDYEYISETAQWLALKEHVSTIDRTHLRVRTALSLSLPP
jgi:hypothetical protein